MAGRYKAYSEYKDSGVEWLGEVPVGWDRVPLKYMALGKHSLFLDGDWIESKDLSDDGIRYITTGSVGAGEFKEQGAGFISEDKFIQLGCTEVFEGDVLISRLNAPIGRSCVVPFHNTRIVTSVDNVIFRPDEEFVKEFLVYLFSSAEYFVHTGNLARGATMQRISRGLLGNVRAVIPTLPEQKQIARFLDHETGKIDALIEKQQALIALLQEKRQAVISHAVTKGLNPDAKMKDSGVEWLGEVPEHWTVGKFGRLAFMQEGPGLRTWQFKDEGTRVICVTNITEHGIDFSRLEKFISIPEYTSSYTHFTVNKGDILLSSSGNSWGKVARYKQDEKVILNTSTIRINELPQRPLIAGYIEHFLRSEACREQLGLAMTGSCQPNFGPTHLNEIKIPLLPTEEQELISQFIVEQIAQYDKPTAASIEAMRLLQERRTALISAAVTGKIDVRDWEPAPEA